MSLKDGPAVYVGTYAKYNAGSLAGAWLNLEDYASHDDFIDAARKLHADESDPELMFQDFQCFPRDYYGESHIKPELWDWLNLNESDRDLLAVYQEHVNQNGDIDEARDAFMGKYDTKRDAAESFLEETGTLEQIPESLRSYFDFDAYARDMEMSDYYFARHDGDVWLFRRT